MESGTEDVQGEICENIIAGIWVFIMYTLKVYLHGNAYGTPAPLWFSTSANIPDIL
jgi:hypothetical protein